MTANLTAISPADTVRAARYLMSNGRVSDALNLLEGVRPASSEYPSFYLVLGECLLASGHAADARKALMHSLSLAPNSARAAILLESIVDADTKNSQATPLVRSKTQPTLAALFGDEPRIRTKNGSAANMAEPGMTAQSESPFDLARVATLLTKSRPLVRPTPGDHGEADLPAEIPYRSDSQLVSETLAGILVGQGKFEEALRAYRRLRDEEPMRREYFNERIEQIELRIRRG